MPSIPHESPASQPTAKHTPGPWDVGEERGCKELPIYDRSAPFNPAYKEAVAVAFEWDNIEERDANARLIAAAPELLAARKQYIKRMAAVFPGMVTARDGASPTYQMVLAAIAKAEGGAE